MSPVSRNTGIDAATTMNVAYPMGLRTSRQARRITTAVGVLPPLSRSSRSRLVMFSTPMIASSTTAPSAMTSPARVIVLMVAPRQ